MPNRIIKESICTSEDYASLRLFERDLFIRLIVSADDYGIFEARPAIIKGSLFPLDNCTCKQIEDALRRLESAGMIILYRVNGRSYLQLTGWMRHQTPRAAKTRYEMPPKEVLQAFASKCLQMQADAPVFENEFEYENDIDIESENDKNKKRPRGEYKNVLLTDAEYEKLKSEFSDLDARIERMSEYMASKGAKYKNHAATIRSWARRDAERAKNESPKGNFDVDEFAANALAKTKRMAEEIINRKET